MGNAPSSSMEMTTDDTIDRLPNDMLVEIFSRMPYKSTCCCKCVSTSWRDLISHPDNRKLMPQSLAGFFYKSYSTRHFTNVSEKGEPLIDSSLPFLPKYESTEVLDCCNGLLLCRCWNSKPTVPKTMDYVVCNPATDKWVVVSATNWSSKVSVARLGFEPAVSSHFHVFEFVPWNVLWRKSEPNGWATDCLLIYSSKTGVWSNKDPPHRFRVPTDSTTVFLRGTLYVSAFDSMVVAFDFEGDYWRFIRAPVTPYIFHRDCPDDIFISQGQLYFTHKGDF